MLLGYLLSSCRNLEPESSHAQGGIVSRTNQNQHKTKTRTKRENKALTGRYRDDIFSSATMIQVQHFASFHHRHKIGRHHLKTAVPCFIIILQKSGFIRISKGFSCKYSKILTQEFSGGFPAQKSAGSIKDSSKLLSSLQHLLTTSERAIDSGENLVGSFLPSYLKAGCFRCCRG